MSDGHKPISSEDEQPLPESAPIAASSLDTSIESVPGYKPRGLAEAAPDAMTAIFDRTAINDAAMGAFRKRDVVEVIIGDDDRQPVPDATQSPWRHICALRIKTKTGRAYVGTGWFIGPRTVMTAGHCVYIHDEGGWAESIEVIPALGGSDRPYGSTRANRFHAVDGWVKNLDSDFDYAAIMLDESLGNKTGWYAFAALDQTALSSADANISGYPADKERASRQYFHARKIVRASQRKLFYEIDTYGGQSGSAIWLQINGKRVVVGVHTTGSSTSNSGTLINQEVFNNMRLWKRA